MPADQTHPTDSVHLSHDAVAAVVADQQLVVVVVVHCHLSHWYSP